MTISRRQAMAWASAFAASAATTSASAASSVARAVLAPPRRGRSQLEPAQLVQQLLIHHDESRHAAHDGIIAIASSDAAWYVIDTLDDTAYRLMNRQNKKRGFRLKRVSAFKTRQGVRYAACWEQVAGPDWHSRHAMTRADFEALVTQRQNNGYRVTHIDARAQYAGIWEKGDASAQQIFARLTPDAYQQQAATLAAQGLRPTRISIGVESGKPYVAAIFDKDGGAAWQAYALMSASDFHATSRTLKAQGYRLRDASGHIASGKPVFSGIWDQA